MYTSMVRKAMLGDTATLNLDFTTGVLDSRLTLTRAAGTATYINSSGYVTTATANTPRFDYDPVTLAPRGLLLEGSATNLLNWSETFATTGGTNNNWAGTNLNRTSTNNTSPRNDATALRVTAINGVGNATLISSAAMSTSASRILSVWLRRVTGTGDIQYTLNNGTNWTTQVITSSWVRYSFPATTAAQHVGFRIVTDGDAIELWGAQLEAGSGGASSYVVTVASQETRNPDTCYLTDFAGWSAGGNFNTAEGTLFVDQAVTFVGTANYPAGGFCTSNTVGSRFGWQYRQGEAPQTYRGLVNAGYLFEMPGGAGWSIPAGTTRFRHAMSCGGNTFLRQSFKSSASSGSPTQNNYSDVSTLNISGVAAFTLTQSAFASSVRIARVKYYPRAFTLTELDQLTN
jgi:hypothetical protein